MTVPRSAQSSDHRQSSDQPYKLDTCQLNSFRASWVFLLQLEREAKPNLAKIGKTLVCPGLHNFDRRPWKRESFRTVWRIPDCVGKTGERISLAVRDRLRVLSESADRLVSPSDAVTKSHKRNVVTYTPGKSRTLRHRISPIWSSQTAQSSYLRGPQFHAFKLGRGPLRPARK